MEQISVPNFVSRKKIKGLTRLELFSAVVANLAAERDDEVDVIVSLMKILSYLRPIRGFLYLNGMFDTLKDLVFHLHSVKGNSKKLISLSTSGYKRLIFSVEIKKNLRKLLHLQSLLKKEHKNHVDMFEENAWGFYDLQSNIHVVESQRKMSEFRHIPFDDRTEHDDNRFHVHYTRIRQANDKYQKLASDKQQITEREQVLRDQLNTLSIQLAILIENRMKQFLQSPFSQLLNIAETTEAARDFMMSLSADNQADVVESYSDLVDEIRAFKAGSVAHEVYLEASDIYVFPSKPQNLIYCPDCGFCIIKGVDNGKMYHYVNKNRTNSNSNSRGDDMTVSYHADIYMRTETNFKPHNERELKLSKGEMVKVKLLSSDGSWAFGWKRSFPSIKKTWGFFPTIVASRIDDGTDGERLLH